MMNIKIPKNIKKVRKVRAKKFALEDHEREFPKGAFFIYLDEKRDET